MKTYENTRMVYHLQNIVKICLITLVIQLLSGNIDLASAKAKMNQSIQGFAPALTRANKISNSDLWKSSEQSTTTETKFDLPDYENLTEVLHTNSGPKPPAVLNKIQQLLNQADSRDVPEMRPVLYASLEADVFDNHRSFYSNHNPESRIQINQAIHKSEPEQKKIFSIDMRDNVTIFLGSDQSTLVPEWLDEWNRLEFTLHNPSGPHYHFQYHQGQNGSLILGNNRAPWHQKTYIALTESSTRAKELNEPTANSLNPLRMLKNDLQVEYELAHSSKISIGIYDMQKNLVKTIANNFEQSAGKHQASFWNGCDENGNDVGNGIYFYKIMSDDSAELNQSLKLVVLR